MVAFNQVICSKKQKQKQTNKNKNKKNLTSIFWLFSWIWISSKSYFFSTSNSFSNYFNKLINILSMFSFLFNTFINLYLGLVVSYIRDLNPQYNFSITASWWESMLANSFKFKSAQDFIHHRPYFLGSVYTQTLWHKQFWDFLSVFSIGSMVSGQFCFYNDLKMGVLSEGGLSQYYLSMWVSPGVCFIIVYGFI